MWLHQICPRTTSRSCGPCGRNATGKRSRGKSTMGLAFANLLLVDGRQNLARCLYTTATFSATSPIVPSRDVVWDKYDGPWNEAPKHARTNHAIRAHGPRDLSDFTV